MKGVKKPDILTRPDLAKSCGGFTIIEIIIFLAVSAAIFASAMTLLSGKQSKTEFSTGITQLTSGLQSAVGNVANGYYNLPPDYKCSAGLSGAPTISGGGSSTLGTNTGCTFIGEVLQFGTGSSDNQTYTIYPVVGRQYAPGGTGTDDVTNLAQAIPTSSIAGPDITSATSLPYGITVHHGGMTYSNGGSTTNIGAVGFLTTFNGYSGSVTNDLNSGSQNVQIIPMPGSSLTETKATQVGQINSLTDNCPSSPPGSVCYVNTGRFGSQIAPKNPDGGVNICFDSGSTGESALMIIGGSNSPTSITLKRFSQKGCA
ncbi:MAG: pilus assembly FimT family protein [Candidatus Saccharimonadales bacterium]